MGARKNRPGKFSEAISARRTALVTERMTVEDLWYLADEGSLTEAEHEGRLEQIDAEIASLIPAGRRLTA